VVFVKKINCKEASGEYILKRELPIIQYSHIETGRKRETLPKNVLSLRANQKYDEIQRKWVDML